MTLNTKESVGTLESPVFNITTTSSIHHLSLAHVLTWLTGCCCCCCLCLAVDLIPDADPLAYWTLVRRLEQRSPVLAKLPPLTFSFLHQLFQLPRRLSIDSKPRCRIFIGLCFTGGVEFLVFTSSTPAMVVARASARWVTQWASWTVRPSRGTPRPGLSKKTIRRGYASQGPHHGARKSGSDLPWYVDGICTNPT